MHDVKSEAIIDATASKIDSAAPTVEQVNDCAEENNDGGEADKSMCSSSHESSELASSTTENSKKMMVAVQNEESRNSDDQNCSNEDSCRQADEPESVTNNSKRQKISRWKILVLGTVSILILIATIAISIQSSPDDEPVYSGQLVGSPLPDNFNNTSSVIFSTNPHLWSDDDFAVDFNEEAMTKQLRFLIDLLSPIVSQISNREGLVITDYIASRRNDDSIVIKGSPQHNALAWLSHAIVCHPSGSSHSTPTNDDYIYGYGYGYGYDDEYDCVSLLSHSQLLNRYALATMYFAWNGKSWKNSEGWMSYHDGREHPSSSLLSRTSKDSIGNTHTNIDVDSQRQPSDICLWEGVTCRHELIGYDDLVVGDTNNNTDAIESSEEGEEIVVLDLSGNNLVGYLGAVKEIRFLGYLEDLDLSENHLEGFVPKEIGLLERLWSLDLSLNRLSGSLPATISRDLSRLEVFRIENNYLVGGLYGFTFDPPCTDAPKLEFSADCSGTKPKVECPCCTKCCRNSANPEANSLRGASGERTEKETETTVCEENVPASSAAPSG